MILQEMCTWPNMYNMPNSPNNILGLQTPLVLGPLIYLVVAIHYTSIYAMNP